MKRPLRSLAHAALACLAGASLAAYGETPMPQSSTTTLCIGRLLVDLPEDVQASISTSYQWIESQESTRVRDFADLEQQLTRRSKDYKAAHMIRDPYGDDLLRAAGLDPDSMYGPFQLVGFDSDSAQYQAILSYHPDPKKSDIVTELHKVVGQRDYVFDTKDNGANDYPKTRQTMWKAGATFQPLAPGALPHGPGFCVKGGMFADAGKPPVRESFTLVVTFPDHPDVRFTIDANAIDKVDKDEPSLKHRVDSELGVLRASVPGHVSVLERGSLKAPGQDGYQIAVSAPYDLVPNTLMRKFFWSADGVPNDVTRPFMEIDMTVQPTNDGPSTIHNDDQAKELWKQLMQGIRIRPGAV